MHHASCGSGVIHNVMIDGFFKEINGHGLVQWSKERLSI